MSILWQDKKRILGMPISFTHYSLTETALCRKKGLFTTEYDQIHLFRITDAKVVRTLFNKLFGVGTIVVYSSDQSHPQFHVHRVKDALTARDLIMNQALAERKRNRVIASDMMTGGQEGEDCADFACDMETPDSLEE